MCVLWLAILSLFHDEWSESGSLLVALVIDVSLAPHNFHGWHLERVVSVDNHRDEDDALVALQLEVVELQVHAYLHVVALLLHFLVEQTDLSAYQLLCRSRGAEGKPCRRKGCSDDMDCFHNRDLLLKMIEYSDG